jgi:DNA-binding XRE family transcriptional regulator
MKTLNDSLQERLNDPEFKVAYEYENILQNIAYQIAKLRHESGFTQKKLAFLLNTQQQVISRIENGNQNISLGMLFRISKILGAKLAVDLKVLN